MQYFVTGGLMCFLSSLYGISDGLTNDSKFYLALLGQVHTKLPTDVRFYLVFDEQYIMI